MKWFSLARLHRLLGWVLSLTFFYLAIGTVAPDLPWHQALSFAFASYLGARMAAEMGLDSHKEQR